MINKIIEGDCLKSLREMPDKSVNCCITSPPYYGLRSYTPEFVKLKHDAPEWVIEKLKELSIYAVKFK